MNSLIVIEAIKALLPEIEGGFSYWETAPDGTEWPSPEDGLVWDNKEIPEPSWERLMSFFPAAELKVVKQQLIFEVNQAVTASINQPYPIDKRVNISCRIGFTDQDFNEMSAFIGAKLSFQSAKIAEINACQSVEELTNISLTE
jgi:hypothetical protein